MENVSLIVLAANDVLNNIKYETKHDIFKSIKDIDFLLSKMLEKKVSIFIQSSVQEQKLFSETMHKLMEKNSNLCDLYLAMIGDENEKK